jgi:hypothetical protein
MMRFGLMVTIFSAGALFADPVVNPESRVPILLELFTSEGCSSCPPADRVLEELDRTQPISGVELIVLSEHVDYWNRLGWKDPFSSSLYSTRQADYANRFHLEGPYTPQLVVDGRFQLVGSDRREAASAIDRSKQDPKVPLTILQVVRNGSQISAAIEVPPSGPQKRMAVLYVVLAEERARSSVTRGENAGRDLAHVSVARVLAQSGPLDLRDGLTKQVVLSVPQGAGADGLRVVAFLQDSSSGRVLGATLRKVGR